MLLSASYLTYTLNIILHGEFVMNIKLNWKLFGLLYLLILGNHLLQICLLGNTVSQTVGVIEYLLFSPIMTFLKYSAYILIGFILFELVKNSKKHVNENEKAKK